MHQVADELVKLECVDVPQARQPRVNEEVVFVDPHDWQHLRFGWILLAFFCCCDPVFNIFSHEILGNEIGEEGSLLVLLRQ